MAPPAETPAGRHLTGAGATISCAASPHLESDHVVDLDVVNDPGDAALVALADLGESS